ncbi:MAG: serine/threonine-protein kinase [Myxococcota bacterium]
MDGDPSARPPTPGAYEDPDVTEVGPTTGRSETGRGASDPTSLVRGATVGRYMILDRLGAGGMGVVHAAYDPDLDRKIALKLLRPGGPGSSGSARSRLLQEARALAKLSHPHVVAVHDVGEHEGEVWLAMEFIDGQTLEAWRTERPRRWTEILEVLLDVGRGVAAAHAAGLVHRDLKPSNVMVGRSGRVRVMDFGLARARAGPKLATAKPSSRPLDPDNPDTSTESHELLGTPAYMAPEQWDRGAIDARTDQFSFCLMAWEALYGTRPFGAGALAVLTEDEIEPPPRRTEQGRIPSWLRRVLERGLARDPQRRWPSMNALLRTLERRRGRRRLQGISVLISAAALTGAGIELYQGVEQEHYERSCEQQGASIERMWPGRAPAVSAGLGTVDAGYAQLLARRLPPHMQAWADDWRRTRVQVCRAGLDGSMNESHRARAELCLEVQRIVRGSLLGMLAEGDSGAIRRGLLILEAAPPIDACADEKWLAQFPLPPLGALPDLRRHFKSATRIQLLQDAGNDHEALVLAEQLQQQAEQRMWLPLRVKSRIRLGQLQASLGHDRAAAQTLYEAYFMAGAHPMDTIALLAATELVRVVGVGLARPDEGLTWSRHARMLLQRMGPDTAEPQGLTEHEARIHWVRGDYRRAKTMLEQDLERRRAQLGYDHPQVALAMRTLADLRLEQGAIVEAVAGYEHVLPILEQSLGVDHPEVARSMVDLAEALIVRGDRDQARALLDKALMMLREPLGSQHLELARPLHVLGRLPKADGDRDHACPRHAEALAIRRDALHPDHPDIATSLAALAECTRQRGHPEQALALYEEGLERLRRGLGDDHPRVATLRSQLAVLHRQRGDRATALRLHEQALAGLVRVHGPEHRAVALAHSERGDTLLDHGDPEHAEPDLRRALTLLERAVGPEHPLVARPLRGLAEVALARGQPEAARALAERARSLLARHDQTERSAHVRFVLGRALWALGDERARARDLVATAHRVLEDLGPATVPERRTIEAWQAEHPIEPVPSIQTH